MTVQPEMDRRTAISMIGLSLAAERTVAREAPRSAAGIKLMVLYGHPPNPEEFRVFEMWFDSPEDMAAVFATPEGMKVRADVANFTAGTTVTRLVCKLD